MTNIFGTDGIRSKVNNSPLTEVEIPILGEAISNWINKKYSNPIVIIAHDTRESCFFIKNLLFKSLQNNNIKIIDSGVLPTPVIFHISNNKIKEFNIGLIISASHNPYQDNGIKIIDYKSGKISECDELFITKEFIQLKKQYINNPKLSEPSVSQNHYSIKDYNDKYINLILSKFKSNLLNNIKVVLDTANGATYKLAPKIFSLLGAKVITINNTPNGKNINLNCGATNTTSLEKSVLKYNAHIGFAFDGDGDRVIVVDKNGKTRDGDAILALLSNHKDYKNITNIVGTMMTNQGLEDYLKTQNKNLIRTSIGDKHILKELDKMQITLGGEQSGHIILKNIINTGDGILVALKILETIISSNNWEINLFNKYPQILINIKIQQDKLNNNRDLTKPPFCDIINNSKSQIENGRILVRYSGTEPLLRIMVEEKEQYKANLIATKLEKELSECLNQVT